MTTRTDPKTVLPRWIELAQEYDRRGDAVLRNQAIRQMRELPLPAAYIKAAQRNAGLIN